MGPIPFGTGVNELAIPVTLSWLTSPTIFDFPSTSILFIPTSTKHAPSLIKELSRNCGDAKAATKISACFDKNF